LHYAPAEYLLGGYELALVKRFRAPKAPLRAYRLAAAVVVIVAVVAVVVDVVARVPPADVGIAARAFPRHARTNLTLLLRSRGLTASLSPRALFRRFKARGRALDMAHISYSRESIARASSSRYIFESAANHTARLLHTRVGQTKLRHWWY